MRVIWNLVTKTLKIRWFLKISKQKFKNGKTIEKLYMYFEKSTNLFLKKNKLSDYLLDNFFNQFVNNFWKLLLCGIRAIHMWWKYFSKFLINLLGFPIFEFYEKLWNIENTQKKFKKWWENTGGLKKIG